MTRLSAALFTLAFVSPLGAWSQAPCTRVAGVVLDSTGALVPGASIKLDEKMDRISGTDGRFAFPCVNAGHHTLVATFQEFAAFTIRVTAPHAGDLTFRLVPSTEASITVNADDNDMQVAAPGGGNGLVVSGKQLQALADDPDDLLRELQQMAAAAGGSPANTTISVDGFQDSAKLPPKSSIAFINVSPDLFSAEYREPPFGGGRVEVYTKPGAKAYHGALFFTNSSSWMNARDPFATSTGTLGKQRYGFDFSGPIRRQGSNFSASLEHRSIDEVAVVNAVTLDGAGNPVRSLDSVPQPQRLWVGQARVDWQLGPKNIAFVSYSANVNSTANASVGGSTLREAGYANGNTDYTVRLSNVTSFSPKLLHEARVSFEWYHENDLPNSIGPSVQVSGYFTGGGASVGNTRQFRTGFENDDDIILTTRHHTLKTGYQLFLKTRDSDLYNGFNGTYVFAGAPQYLTKTPEVFTNVSGNPRVRVKQVRFAAFYQDDMKLRDNLTFSFGVRYFLESDPATFANFTPRLGFALSPDKKKTWQVKSHFGLFNGQLSADEAEELHREDGVQRITSLVYNPLYGSPLTNATPIHAQRTLGPGFTPGTYAIGDLSVSKDLPFGFNLNVESIFIRFLTYDRTVNINQPLDANPYGVRPLAPNLNILQVQSNGTGQGRGEFIGLSNFKRKRVQFFVAGLHINIRENTDDQTFFQPQSAYTDAGEQARRDNQGLWQVFGNATISLPWKLSLAGNGFSQCGKPFNITTGSDNNGDGNFNDRPQYAAPGAVANGTTVFATPFGLLTNAGPIVNGIPLRPIARDMGALPWNFHLDANLQRAFVLNKDTKAEHPQTLTANIRSANFLNHTNVTAEGSVLGSPQFLVPVSGDTGRRIEFGLRYSF